MLPIADQPVHEIKVVHSLLPNENIKHAYIKSNRVVSREKKHKPNRSPSLWLLRIFEEENNEYQFPNVYVYKVNDSARFFFSFLRNARIWMKKTPCLFTRIQLTQLLLYMEEIRKEWESRVKEKKKLIIDFRWRKNISRSHFYSRLSRRRMHWIEEKLKNIQKKSNNVV